MKAPITVAVLALLGSALLVGFFWRAGKIDEWRTPGLAECEAFTKAGLASPSSYKRVSFVVVDTPISKTLLAEATFGPGFDAMASAATNPGIRGIALDYDANNSFGASLRGMTACQFPMSDIKSDEPFGDLASLARTAESVANLGRLGFGKAKNELCCLASTFDDSKIAGDPQVEAAAKDAKTTTTLDEGSK